MSGAKPKKSKSALRPSERDALILHGVFAIVAAAVLLAPLPVVPGWRYFLLLVVYNLAVPVLAIRLGYRRWLDIWLFVFPLSLFQVMPDWFLSAILGALVFPDTGFPFIGTVPVYMAFMWSVPVFAILFCTWRMRKKLSRMGAYLLATVLTVLVFGISEATLWMLPIWYAAPHIFTIAYVAVYVLIAEALLGVAAWYAYQSVADRSLPAKVIAAFAVMLIYTGALACTYVLIEGPRALTQPG